MSPNKKLKLDPGEMDEHSAALILPEIELEIGIRKRLAQTIEDRIAWAEVLREALLKGRSSNNSSGSFKDTALSALATIEKPLDFLYDREDRYLLPALTSQPQDVLTPKPPRPPPKAKIFQPPTHSRKHGKFLYTYAGDQLYLLACPSCQKSEFSSLQGLYNHARITHQLEWGTHEECVRACSIPRDDLDLQKGVEIAVTLLGVRGMFQKAVEEQDHDAEHASGDVNLNSTLGLHAETPALAAILGKEVKRREIRVFDADVDVDIDTLVVPPRWKIPNASRNNLDRRRGDDEIPLNDEAQALPEFYEDASGTPIPTTTLRASRFYISARVIIIDRSLLIIGDHSDGTHKWMLSVEAPSYSLDITTILTRVTASSLSEQVQFPPVVTTEPPFVVRGQTSKPFLCRLELVFCPARGQNADGQTVILEHWINLDLTKSKYAVRGEEQIVDIELHKDTVFRPVQTGYTSIDSRTHWIAPVVKQEVHLDPDIQPSTPEPQLNLSPSDILRQVMPEFPLTLAGASSYSSGRSYMVVGSRAQFNELIPGRRKAIEWGRAKAVRDGYVRVVEATYRGAELPVLSTADVLRWLQLEDIRRNMGIRSSAGTGARQWCLICGFAFDQHPTQDLQAGGRCSFIPHPLTALPIIDIDRVLSSSIFPYAPPPSNQHRFIHNPVSWTPKAIVRASEPSLLLAVKDVIDKQKLSVFSTTQLPAATFPLDALGEDVDGALAPHGVMALLVKQFIRRLMVGGLKSMEALGKRGVGTQDWEGRVLTPTHVLQGIVDGRTDSEDRIGDAIYYTLARMGRRLGDGDGNEMVS